ncbi:MAG TPA: hypothetical protein VH596_15925, partial [Terriglobales bacterium]
MKNKLYCNPLEHARAISRAISAVLLTIVIGPIAALAGDAPQWMHAVVNAPLPAHDEKTDAVLLYSDKSVTVESPTKIKIVVRRAYKILRPDGRQYGVAVVPFNSPSEKVTEL